MARSFTFPGKVADIVATLPVEQQAEFVLAIVRYGCFGEEPELSYPLNALFIALRDRIDDGKEA